MRAKSGPQNKALSTYTIATMYALSVLHMNMPVSDWIHLNPN